VSAIHLILLLIILSVFKFLIINLFISKITAYRYGAYGGSMKKGNDIDIRTSGLEMQTTAKRLEDTADRNWVVTTLVPIDYLPPKVSHCYILLSKIKFN